jgi:hypothetical protein
MAGKSVLLPFNFTDYDEKALHYVIRTFAGQKWVKLTLFHVYTPLPEIDGYANPTLSRLKTTMASLWKELREKEAELKKTREDLLENGFADEQVDCIFKSRVHGVGSEIVDMAQTGPYDTVVLSHKPSKAVTTFRRSVHDKVLSTLKDRTISIIT